jgi:putative acetyltransferase
MGKAALDVRRVQHAGDWRQVRSLLVAYAEELGVDLSFQGFAEELDALPAAYPSPGGVWLAVRAGTAVGCVALRPFGDGVAELKRLFAVRPVRRSGVGRVLVEAALGAARAAGFRAVRLDTVRGMEAAQALYTSFGFVPIAAYRENPLPGARFLELTL